MKCREYGQRYKEKKDNGIVSQSSHPPSPWWRRGCALTRRHTSPLEMKALCGLPSSPLPSPPIRQHPSAATPPNPSFPLPWPPSCPPCGLDVHCGAASIQSRSSHTGFSVPSLTCSLGCLSQRSEERLYIRDHFGGRPFTARQRRATDQQTLTPMNTRKSIVCKREGDQYVKKKTIKLPALSLWRY